MRLAFPRSEFQFWLYHKEELGLSYLGIAREGWDGFDMKEDKLKCECN